MPGPRLTAAEYLAFKHDGGLLDLAHLHWLSARQPCKQNYWRTIITLNTTTNFQGRPAFDGTCVVKCSNCSGEWAAMTQVVRENRWSCPRCVKRNDIIPSNWRITSKVTDPVTHELTGIHVIGEALDPSIPTTITGRPIKHGLSGYMRHKCPCPICTSAYKTYFAAYNAKRLIKQKEQYHASKNGGHTKRKGRGKYLGQGTGGLGKNVSPYAQKTTETDPTPDDS